jgi:hypothetical protein
LFAAFMLVSLSAAQDHRQASSVPASRENTSYLGKIEHHYTMNVRVNIIIFRHTWNNVGGGRIGWIENLGGEKGIELLIGTDPVHTPRKINKWGFITEHVSGSSANLIGIMTQSDEESVEEAKASVEKSGKEHVFKAIRSQSSGNEMRCFTLPLHQAENYSYKEADQLLDKIPKERVGSVRKLEIPDGADPGFLFSVSELIDESVDKYRSTGKLKGLKQHQYVYNAALFELSIEESEFVKKLKANGKEYHELIKSEFKARNKATKASSKFTLTYGIDGQFSGVPICIEYSPRWYLNAKLLLDENAGMVNTAQKTGEE